MTHWTALMRQKHRETEKIPYYVPIGDDDPNFKRLFIEDDARPPDAEHGSEAWKRIFDETMPPLATAKHSWDGGDHTVYLFSHNRVYISAYDGTSIYQYIPDRKFD